MNTISYLEAVNRVAPMRVLCNNIVDVDQSIYDNLMNVWSYTNPDDDEEENLPEIYQWFLTNADENDVKYAQMHYPEVIFVYSDVLDLYVLAVQHYGTSWDSVKIDEK